MGRPSFTLPPCRLQVGGEAGEIDDDRLLRLRRFCPTLIDALAQLGLSGADLGEQHDGVGLGLELSEAPLALLGDCGMGKDAARRRRVSDLMCKSVSVVQS